MSNLATKKKMLVAESEVYRQLLKMELETFKVYGMRTKRRLTSVTAYFPWVMSGLPIVTRLFARKKRSRGFSLKRFSSLFLFGWKAYRQFAPFLNVRFRAPRMRSKETAAQEYLANRL